MSRARKQQWPRLAWPLIVFIGLLAVDLVMLFAVLPCMMLPYVPSKTGAIMLGVVVPLAVFGITYGVFLYGNEMNRRYPSQRGNGEPVSFFAGLGGCSFLGEIFALCLIKLAAVPTFVFAHQPANRPVIVERVTGFGGDYTYRQWVRIKPHPRIAGWRARAFMWNRPDRKALDVQPGDCIGLHGRQWAIGLYVESISKPQVCPIDGASAAQAR